MWKLPYYVRNGSDGSASVEFMPSLKEAKQADEDMDVGWGESSADEVELKVEDGKLYFHGWDKDYHRIWIEVAG